MPPPPTPGFKGNKSHLPQKPCAACGLPMTWRKKWARKWESVLYCSDACRRAKKAKRPKPDAPKPMLSNK